ncbi:sugar ABC transporter ATP-binding protein [Kaistia algarum]|uniref:sugar ABC transporter ATP-binding protein n=1 Tax=Kaistia algarum TaxID=2083279 RepID=UPI000CE7436F|nr:sugar ABC transporter ATP-binding protein [Kaistia algarum]MCX5512975.1 sugar ABC transporter ATP-binding protein [Kaistia algarum]PPE81538.1 sugar ABC transporter ATP-binding protein [Kaistia algarum]
MGQPAATQPVLQLEGVSKSFGGVKALHDMHFDLRKGEVHALVGGNGAGKSTLMKILSGVYQRDSGTIKIDGQVKNIETPNDAMANGVRMVFQELSLIPTLTVMENIFLNHEEVNWRFVLDTKAMLKRTKALLDELGIDLDPNQKVSSLSVGYCQLVEIAKSLSVQASILIMDEPTASLTAAETKLLFDIIRLLKSKGVSIIYISHRMKEIFEIADRITVLKDGRWVLTEEKDDLDLGRVIDSMIGKALEKAFEWKDRARPASDEPILEVEALSQDDMVRDVSFDLKKGEVLGIAGLMGSGRTELLEALFGLRRMSAGSIRIHGRDVTISGISDALENKIALVPEDRRRSGLIAIHSVRDNAALPTLSRFSKLGILAKARIAEMVEGNIKDLSIKTDSADRLVSLLSGGNQQKVVIAKWLNTSPDILLLDEPTAGVDVSSKGEIIDFIRSFASTGKSVILVSSEITELLAVSDRILVLTEGKITRELMREAIHSEEEIQIAIQK